MSSAFLQAIGSKYLIFTAFLYVARTFSVAFVMVPSEGNNNTVTVPEDTLSFLSGFVDMDMAAGDRRVVKRSVPAVESQRVPRFMLDLYERLEDRRLHVKFDTVRSFHCEGVSDFSQELPSTMFKKNSNLIRLVFNISHFPHSEYALFAQLRIQVVHSVQDKRFETKNLDTFSLLGTSPTLLSSRDFDPLIESLYTTNVTSVFHNALESSEKQLLFGLSIPDDFRDLFSLDPSSVDGPQLLVMSKTVQGHQGDQEDRILNRMRRSLNEFNGSRNAIMEAAPSRNSSSGGALDRRRRSEEEDEEAEEQSNYIVEELGRIRKGKLRRKKNPCRRKPLHVNFADINYDQWIIAPPSYEAFECTGRCSFPMSAHLAPTKHAIIQTLMHSLEPKQVSRAACVPIRLTPISILYVDDKGGVTYIYEYGDMVVAECGCR